MKLSSPKEILAELESILGAIEGIDKSKYDQAIQIIYKNDPATLELMTHFQDFGKLAVSALELEKKVLFKYPSETKKEDYTPEDIATLKGINNFLMNLAFYQMGRVLVVEGIYSAFLTKKEHKESIMLCLEKAATRLDMLNIVYPNIEAKLYNPES